MRRSDREAVRERRDAQKRERAARAAHVVAEVEARSAKSAKALARWSAPRSPLEKALAEYEAPRDGGHFRGPLFDKVPAAELPRTPERVAFLRVVDAKASRLIDVDYMPALLLLAKLTHIRPIDTWEPRGKGREALFRSLAEHLLAKYTTPTFLWSVLFSIPHDCRRFVPFVVHVAGGGSVQDAVKNGTFPIPFTRRMSHDFMQTPSDVPFLRAVRRAQALACGVDTGRFLNAWMGSVAGREIHDADMEKFWLTVMEWFGKNPMIDPNQVGPLIDFINYRRRQDPAYSLKGRTGVTLMRAMEEWHAELAQAKVHTRTANTYKPSGFRGGEFDKSRYDETKSTMIEKHVWHVREILTVKDLAAEGRHMHHCVFSYSWSIERGTVSIWSLSHETWGGDERCITVEVNNRERRIVQARGKYNRAMDNQERMMLTAWAHMAGLQLGAYL